jgi:hypothetical protein
VNGCVIHIRDGHDFINVVFHSKHLYIDNYGVGDVWSFKKVTPRE